MHQKLKEQRSELRLVVQSYFRKQAVYDISELKEIRFEERMRQFDAASHCASYLEEHDFPLAGRTILDAACGWGGPAIAFAAAGAKVIAYDNLDYHFGSLRAFAIEHHLDINVTRATYSNRALLYESLDAVAAIDLVEHLCSVEQFAAQTVRVLKPGGICVVVTPPRALSVFRGEPHYSRKGFAVLPLRLQLLSTVHPIGRVYEKPIYHQFGTAESLIRLFNRHGMEGVVVRDASPEEGSIIEGMVRRVVKRLFWDFIVLVKPPSVV
jgi:2-polyprenyl-3-methyl-5-hydroxy-6-metoxy-1,4-benzoquinol methylase